jgi:uncharacterized membrane protein
MSELAVVAFDDKFKAEEVLISLNKMQRDYLVDLEDAVTVVKDETGKIKLKQSVDLTRVGAVAFGWWGLLVGTLIGGPIGSLLGGATGAAVGAISGKLSDYGIDDEFIRNIGNTLAPNTSAIFVLVKHVTPDRVFDELKKFDGKVLKTSLSKADEANLQEVLQKHV